MTMSEGSTDGTKRPTAPAIDIEKLTEKVYQLMRAEIRLARKRGVRNQRRT